MARVPHTALPELERPALQPGSVARVVAIVLNYKTATLSIAAVEALCRSRLATHELNVVVVDNGSGNEDVARLRAALTPDCVSVVALPVNLGYAAGNNAGIQFAKRRLDGGCCSADDAILLLNSDVTVHPDALQQCLDYLARHPNVGVVGPKVLLPDGRLDLACRRSFPDIENSFWKLTGFARRFPNHPRLARYNLTFLDENETVEVDSVVGAFMLVRWQAVQAAGRLDESFFMYGEDLDWSYRIKAHGWRVMYYPKATVVHLKGETTRRQSNRMIFQFYRSMWLFHTKHYADRTLFVINWLILTGIIVRGTIAFGRNVFRPAALKRVT